MAKDTTFIDNMLRKIRRNGYATNDGEWQDQAKVAAMGMPIRHNDGVIGSINLVYLRKAISMNDAVARYLPPMQEAVARIEAQLSASAAPVRNAEGDKPNKPPSRRRTRQPE